MIDNEQLLVEQWALSLHRELEPYFSPETALPGSPKDPPSSGHCAAVAWLIHSLISAELWSAKVDGTSHWFNVVDSGHLGKFAIDLTAEQFPSLTARRCVVVRQLDCLDQAAYEAMRQRQPEEVIWKPETEPKSF